MTAPRVCRWRIEPRLIGFAGLHGLGDISTDAVADTNMHGVRMPPSIPSDKRTHQTTLFGLQSGPGSWQDGGMANVAKSKKNPAAVALGRLGGLKGGPARTASMTPVQRKTAARKAAQARWSKKTG